MRHQTQPGRTRRTVQGRAVAELVAAGWTFTAAADALGMSLTTAWRWCHRVRQATSDDRF
jgi:DNA-directed RNA polymerase specialized sigma24 family protein